MITQAVIDLWASFVAWVVALIPELEGGLPPQVATFDTTVNELLAMSSGLGAWIDWGYAVIILTAVLAVWLIALTIRFVRWAISFVPTMSGGT